MKDIDRLFLIMYVNVSGLSEDDSYVKLTSYDDFLKHKLDYTVKHFIIPVLEGDTRIEFFKADGSTTAVAIETIEELKKSIIEKYNIKIF